MSERAPNIILIVTDQQRRDSLSCYGSDFTATPHIDQLAEEGALFARAYCPSSVCTPSRASLLTGCSVSHHGAWNVGVNVPDGHLTTLAHRLGAAGYGTHMIGKAHLQSSNLKVHEAREDELAENPSVENRDRWRSVYPHWTGPYHGFDTVELAISHTIRGITGHYGAWVMKEIGEEGLRRLSAVDPPAFQGAAIDWDLPTRLHNSVWTADRTIAFLERHDMSRPFVLWVGFQDPHHPHAVPRDWNDRVDAMRVPLPDWTEGELDDKPPHFRAARCGTLSREGFVGEFGYVAGTENEAVHAVTESDARRGRAYYYTMVKLIDHEVGRILAALDQLQVADNTLVIFTTDHGELLGDHGLWGKGPFHYEQLVRIPLIARWPAAISGGQHISALASLVDIVPTCLSAAGLPVPYGLDGVDLLPLLRGEVGTVRNEVLVESVDDPRRLRAKSIVTADGLKLTWHAGPGMGELYDLRSDPREKVNLWCDDGYAHDKAKLLGRIIEHMETLEADRRLPRVSAA